jgi:hypothetical protein
MERIGDITGIISLLFLAEQDFRLRKISGGLLILFLTGIIVAFLSHNHPESILYFFPLNLGFLFFQFVFLWGWFRLKNKKHTPLINTMIGIGDILFFICMAAMFSPGNFIVVFVGDMIFALLVTLAVKTILKKNIFEIPLAGLLSIPLIGLCVLRLVNPSLDFYDDNRLVSFFETF